MKRNTEQLKNNLIQVGIEEISRHGIDQLSLRTVAQKCGVTHGAPYKHFGSKEGYLQALLSQLSSNWAEKMTSSIPSDVPAKEQLTQMGVQFVLAAQESPHLFEALFVKYPFQYAKVSANTIRSDENLPGFDRFKEIVLKLRQEEAFTKHEYDTLIHFWSFISGLAILSVNPIGLDLTQASLQESITSMLAIYIKGENA